ncbi:SDR family NAD(P)-dependent oxidoreductase [Ottowia sp. VDI28]|uniref:SDR family NAD(P)-dependent oxidoreductase n=1 Tax=Ottowia sp. VDI28 TaxID=3133968 RepID=UPI003C309B91
MNVTFDFTSRSVLVAGAASGIGRSTALRCLEAGATVLAMDVDASGLASLPQDGRMLTAKVDIADPRAVQAAIDDFAGRTGRIDGAVLTSAIQKRTPIDETTDADWQRHLDVNLSGIFYLVRALYPVMKRQRSGSIVAFTSGLASNGWAGAAAYAATKAGIVGLVKSAALELRTHGVRINALSPGLVATPVFLNSASEEELAMYERTLGVSQPEEVADTLMYLLSDIAAGISGNVVERRLIARA